MTVMNMIKHADPKWTQRATKSLMCLDIRRSGKAKTAAYLVITATVADKKFRQWLKA